MARRSGRISNRQQRSSAEIVSPIDIRPAEASSKPCLLFTLPLELRLQILRHLVPSRQYFLIRNPRTIAFRTEGVQKLLHEPFPEVIRSDKWSIKLVDETVDPLFNMRVHDEEPSTFERPRRFATAARRIWRSQPPPKDGTVNNKPVILTGARTQSPSRWLPLFKVSRQFQQDCYKLLYEENRYIFHLGSPGSCKSDACITSGPFSNPLHKFMDCGREGSGGPLQYITKLHLDVKICLDKDLDDGAEDNKRRLGVNFNPRGITPPSQPTRTEYHQHLLESWMSELSAELMQRDVPLNEFSLRVKHYRPATAEFQDLYTLSIPEGVPYHMDLQTWTAKHRAWADFNVQVPTKIGYPSPEIFSSLKVVNGVNYATVSGLDKEENRAIEKAMMSKMGRAPTSMSAKRVLDSGEDGSDLGADAPEPKRARVHENLRENSWISPSQDSACPDSQI